MAYKYRETYTYRDPLGIRQTIRVGGKDKAETDEKFQEFLMGNLQDEKMPTFQAFVDDIYRPTFIQQLAATTQTNYEIYLKKYIFPFLGEMKLSQVSVVTIQQFYDWMASSSQHGYQKDLNYATINRVGGLTSRIFRVAVELEIIKTTPFKHTLLRNRGEKAGHHKPLSDEEIDRVKREIPLLKNENERLYMGLLAYTGMRREEVLGLQWENIHLEQRYGEVEKVVVYPGNSVAVIKENPKTEASERFFIIPQALYDLLAPCRRISGYVIHGEDPEAPASVRAMQSVYRGAFSKLKIKGLFDNHDFRTTFATQMKEIGLTAAQVADLMGHADTRMVETVYARARKSGIMKQRDAIEAINSGYVIGTSRTQNLPQNPLKNLGF